MGPAAGQVWRGVYTGVGLRRRWAAAGCGDTKGSSAWVIVTLGSLSHLGHCHTWLQDAPQGWQEMYS